MILKIIMILTLILILLYLGNFLKLKRKKKVFKAKNLATFDKRNLNNWMNLTKKERYDLAKQESVSYLDKRKLLLEEIRQEYKKISSGNSEGNTNN